MPDNNNINEQADILSKLLGRGTQSQSDLILKYLRHIDDTLAEMNDDGKTNARKQRNDRATATTFQDRLRDRNGQSKSSTAPTSRKRNGFSSVQDSFVSGFQSEFTDKIKRDIGTQFRKQIGDIYDDITKELGISLKDAPNALGKAVGIKLRNTLRSTGINSVVESKLNEATQGIKDYVFNKVASVPSIAEPLDKIKKAYIQGRDAAGQISSKENKHPQIPEKVSDHRDTSEDTQVQKFIKAVSSIPDILKYLNDSRSSSSIYQNHTQQQGQAQDSLDFLSGLGSIGGVSRIIDGVKNLSNPPRQSIADRQSIDLNNDCCCNADMLHDKDDILSSVLDRISDIADGSVSDAISEAVDKLSDVAGGNYSKIIDAVTSFVGDISSSISDITTVFDQYSGEHSVPVFSISDFYKLLFHAQSDRAIHDQKQVPQQIQVSNPFDIFSSIGEIERKEDILSNGIEHLINGIGSISSILDHAKNKNNAAAQPTVSPTITNKSDFDLSNFCCCNADMLAGDMDDILSSALGHLSDITRDSISDSVGDIVEQLADHTNIDLRGIIDAVNGVTKNITDADHTNIDLSEIIDAVNGNYSDIIGTVTSLLGDSSSAISDVSSLASTVSEESSASIAGFTNAIDTVLPMLKEGAANIIPKLTNEVLPNLISEGQTAATMIAEGGKAILPVLTEAGSTLSLVGLSLVAGYLAFKKLHEILEPVRENLKKLSDEVKKTADRVNISRTKNADLATDRLQKDIETMVKKPFEILQAAAEEWYSTWNSNLKVITATQGYSKADLQTLMGNYAERLRREGLESYVSASDISANLANVLKDGLSGKVAEEFAYIATKLNAAVPTQDFFQSASSYASIVANAVKDGKSQTEAIKLANDTMMKMASNVLYASRELTNGVTTGLKDAQSIMERSIQIAQTGRTDNAVAISGVMTSVSAIIGAIAPDLASVMTEAVYKAAVGGNSSEIVALRSLAGINASNTEFLRQLTDDPKKVFVDLFENLGRMQNMSQDAYMEVAEGLSNIFGLSMDTFARVDFEYLARAIANMSTTSNAIDENLELLMSGQTTTTAEQLKIQQINKYMIDEGLAYVIDNEAAQMIQQHMWDEQIARQIMESQYAVDLSGSSLQLLESIAGSVDNIGNYLNPIGFFGKLGRLIVSTAEPEALEHDITAVLDLGKVGTGQEVSRHQLTTRGKDLKLTKNLVSMMGGLSDYSMVTGIGNLFSFFSNPVSSIANSNHLGIVEKNFQRADMAIIDLKRAKSSYNWGTIGKSTASTLNASTVGPHLTGLSDIQEQASEVNNTALAQAKAVQNLQDMIDSMNNYVLNDKDYDATYEDWVATAKKYGISDFSAAIEDAGITDEKLRTHFDGLKMQIGAQIRADREGREEEFWNVTKENIVAINDTTVAINDTTVAINDTTVAIRDITDLIRETGEAHLLETIDFKTITSEILTNIFDMNSKIYDEFLKFYASWVDYYVDHTAYSSAYDHEEVSKIQREEKAESEDAVYALADALTKNTVDLLDPTVQTNALLSQILKVANAILNATNTPNGTTIPDSLSGMALGLTSM